MVNICIQMVSQTTYPLMGDNNDEQLMNDEYASLRSDIQAGGERRARALERISKIINDTLEGIHVDVDYFIGEFITNNGEKEFEIDSNSANGIIITGESFRDIYSDDLRTIERKFGLIGRGKYVDEMYTYYLSPEEPTI